MIVKKNDWINMYVSAKVNSPCSSSNTASFGVVLQNKSQFHNIGDREFNTSLPRCELLAVVRGFEALPLGNYDVKIFTKSNYISDAINQNRLYEWANNYWVKPNGECIKNYDLWKRLYMHIQRNPNVYCHKVCIGSKFQGMNKFKAWYFSNNNSMFYSEARASYLFLYMNKAIGLADTAMVRLIMPFTMECS